MEITFDRTRAASIMLDPAVNGNSQDLYLDDHAQELAVGLAEPINDVRRWLAEPSNGARKHSAGVSTLIITDV